MKKLFIISFILFVTMFGLFKNLLSSGSNNEELAKIIQQNAFLVDVRTPQEFAAGSVKGAVNIPLDSIQNQLSLFKGKNNVVVFCRSGNRSGQAQAILKQNGIENVYNGGTWQNVNQLLKK
jgi:phage shock protein E